MKGYKIYGPGMICKGKQYAENTTFEEKSVEICKKGMHFCKNPLDCLDYYPLINITEVEALDNPETNDGKKYASKNLRVGGKLTLAQFIKDSFFATYENIKSEAGEAKDIDAGGDGATLAGGDGAKLAGGDGATLAGGDGATLAGGYRATLAGGDGAKLAGGYRATLAGGDGATLAGGDGAILCGDSGSIAKGGIGSLIVIAKRDNKGKIIDYAVKIVDGEIIKADTWYKLADGDFIEA